MICKKCGSKIYDKSVFCTVCGQRQKSELQVEEEKKDETKARIKFLCTISALICFVVIFFIVANSLGNNRIKDKVWVHDFEINGVLYGKDVFYFGKDGKGYHNISTADETVSGFFDYEIETNTITLTFDNGKNMELEYSLKNNYLIIDDYEYFEYNDES